MIYSYFIAQLNISVSVDVIGKSIECIMMETPSLLN